ncbi:MAG: polyprenyl synthetase family protein [Candidatus Saganbacteria bacterium]|nr:polyprenyl synthetase family protein [Candidatus Saganbacteria bacterium]
MFADEIKIVDRALKKYLPKDNSVLSKAMRYSIFAGGKRFRPSLMLLTTKMLRGKIADVLPAACSVEMIHTFTLIHDDLPCMDNSDLRRGKPTCHKKYGEAIALLAGDGLNTLAFKIISDNCPPKRSVEVVSELSAALLEVVEGQVLDLEAGAGSVSQLKKIHLKKTASLIRASVKIAAILANAKRKEINSLSKYGEEMGLAFQIADDILDFASTPEILGKPTGSDSENQKSTYPLFLGVDEAKKLSQVHCKRAAALLKQFGRKAERLRETAYFSVRRLI